MNRHSPRTTRLKGFSLIEILVVLVVTAVLMLLTVTSFERFIYRSDQTVCAANLRQVGKALFLYVQDHDGNLPGLAGSAQRPHYRNTTLADPSALVDYLQPYLGVPEALTRDWLNADMLTCPAGIKQNNPNRELGVTHNQFFNHYTTWFGVGDRIRPFGYMGKEKPDHPVKLVNITRPSETMSLVDRLITPEFHGDMRNVLFIDGHVKSLPVEAFVRRADSTFEIVY